MLREREKKTTMTTMYARTTTTTILLHSIAIRQNRTIEKEGNERERTHTYNTSQHIGRERGRATTHKDEDRDQNQRRI